MKNSYAHISNGKWRSFRCVMIAFILIFSTSSFASANSFSQSMHSDYSMETSTSSPDHMGEDDAMPMTDSHECCEDDDSVPCNSDNDCDMPCMTFSTVNAVLTSMSSLLLAPTGVLNTPEYNLENGISDQLNAPPPRT